MEKMLETTNSTLFTGRGYDAWLFPLKPSFDELMFTQELFEDGDPAIYDQMVSKRMQVRVLARFREVKT